MFAAVRRFKGLFAVAALGIAVSFVAVDMAEARRAGGGFGTRTFSAPPATNTAPGQAAPINRSMTPNTSPSQAAPGAAQTRPANAQQPQQNRGLFGGMAGGLMGGLLMGGLFGMLLGGGFGGMAGFFGMLLQVALIGVLVMLAMRFFASRRQQQPAYAGAQSQRSNYSGSSNPPTGQGGSFKIPQIGSLAGAAGNAAPAAEAAVAPKPVPHANAMSEGDEIGVTGEDLGQFEQMLKDVQAAYAAEDYAALRKLTTPEAMSYLAEELSDNATSGVKNDVRDVQLLQGDLAEAWHEEGRDYATVAMLYSRIDVMRDRTTGKVIEGDENQATESTELWTFVRREGSEWQVSAIQSAS